jgi:hypothetical protein
MEYLSQQLSKLTDFEFECYSNRKQKLKKQHIKGE